MKKVVLPIDAFRAEILASIKENPVTVIVAETGAGKSTRVPQFLLESTAYEVVVTQPRRVAAKSVAKRVAEEMNCRFGGLVGFRTAADRNDGAETRCLFVTDGLQLVRELTSAKQTIGRGVVLILDEVHEWNINIETLVAWVKKAIQEGLDIKVVLMSATLDHEKLSDFFGNAPVINVPGRCFPVVGSPSHADGLCQKSAKSMTDEIRRLVAAGRNVLAFLPGKGEIAEMEKALQGKMPAVILPLHGDLEPAEQDRAFNSYRLPKVILSTNIAQTSVTIPDITAVVDSGLERRIELVNNVETLMLSCISQADCLQRAGRAGRVSEGEYALCNDRAYSDFAKYPTPEIQRTLLDQMVLRLAGAGLDATTLPFYHQPDSSVLAEAKETLIAISALDGRGKITSMGNKINRFPTDVKAARMVIEAIDRKCLSSVITIAAVLGAPGGSLRRRRRDDDPAFFKGWETLISPDKKYQSDLLVELELFWQAKNIGEKALAQNGIMPKAYGKAAEIRGQLREALQSLGYRLEAYSQNEAKEEAILKSVASGMVVHLYRHTGGGNYRNGDSRTLAKESILNRLGSYPAWIVGEPKNITFIGRKGRQQTINLAGNCTVVDPAWMAEIAPHLISQTVGRLYWSNGKQSVVEDHAVEFNGQEISREAKIASWSEEAFMVFINNMQSSYSGCEIVNELYRANVEIMNQYHSWYRRAGGAIESKDNSETIGGLYQRGLASHKPLGFSRLLELLEKEVKEANLRLRLSDLLSAEMQAEIEKDSPLAITIAGKETPVTYSWGSNAQVDMTEEQVAAFSGEQVLLPSGREVSVTCGGYSGTLSDVRASLRYSLESNFRNEISELLAIPYEAPFKFGGYLWVVTETGKILARRFEALQAEMIEGLTFENSAERVEMVRGKAEALKDELRAEYEKAQALIASSEESFEKILAEIDQQDFIEAEVLQARTLCVEARVLLENGKFAEIEQKCLSVVELKSSLASLQESRQNDWDERVNAIPENIWQAFKQDARNAIQFMENVAKLPVSKLDGWILKKGSQQEACNHLYEISGRDFFANVPLWSFAYEAMEDVLGYVVDCYFSEQSTTGKKDPTEKDLAKELKKKWLKDRKGG